MTHRIVALFAVAAFTSIGFGQLTEVTGVAIEVADTATAAKVCEKACAEKCAEKCAKGECTEKCKDGCPIEAAMGKLPKMTYLVGSESTCCSKSAAELAEKHNSAIKFVVGKKTYEEKGPAMVALADATEQFVSTFTTPVECKKSGKFTITGQELCCSKMAGERAELAKKAMKDVHLTYQVGDEKCNCPNKAASLAKSSGATKYILVGKEKTCCDVDARVKLAQAKYRAAVAALLAADAKQVADKG